MKGRRDAFSMLRGLPAVFDLRDMEIYLGISRAYAKNAASRWAEREMIAPLGPRAGVYFNLVADPHGPSARIKEAVDKLLRRPVIGIGAFALHQHGWTTQRPYRTDIAVLMGGPERTIPQMKGILAVGRRVGWFQALLPRSETGIDGFLVAPPEFALVDTIMAAGAGGLWNPDPSDIDVPLDIPPAEAVQRIEEAALLLKADIGQVRDFVSRIDGLDAAAPTP